MLENEMGKSLGATLVAAVAMGPIESPKNGRMKNEMPRGEGNKVKSIDLRFERGQRIWERRRKTRRSQTMLLPNNAGFY